MLLILISMIIGLFLAIYVIYTVGGYLFEYIFYSIISIIIFCVLGFIISVMLPMDTYNKHYSLNIESLQDNSSLSGKFFLGSGQINGEMKYIFYYEENGLFRMMQVDYNLVQIKYTNGEPKVNVTEKSPTDALINSFAIDFDLFDKTYIIEVPKGTIKNNYNLDAQ